ncbi:MAG TPA: nucleotidyltransferase family protein [Solirubrobacteraceae bacterium]|nr:nucleotidyltransferase family protein [Solirubrobacteraceae bacterium]
MDVDATPGAVGDPTMVAAARRVCEEAESSGVDVRLLGGIAIWVRASEATRLALGREYADIDLVTTKRQAKGLRELLERLGYVPDKMFNATQGDTRLYYHSPDGAYHVDVFVEKFVMSHELDLGSRLRTEPITLPAAELVLTKLQIAELNHKDASDTAMLLADHELAGTDGAGVLNMQYVSELCASDWGLYTTVTDNLEKTRSLLAAILSDSERRRQVEARIQRLLSELEAAPKSGGWRRRAKIGRRKRWYQTPDEADR